MDEGLENPAHRIAHLVHCVRRIEIQTTLLLTQNYRHRLPVGQRVGSSCLRKVGNDVHHVTIVV